MQWEFEGLVFDDVVRFFFFILGFRAEIQFVGWREVCVFRSFGLGLVVKVLSYKDFSGLFSFIVSFFRVSCWGLEGGRNLCFVFGNVSDVGVFCWVQRRILNFDKGFWVFIGFITKIKIIILFSIFQLLEKFNFVKFIRYKYWLIRVFV